MIAILCAMPVVFGVSLFFVCLGVRAWIVFKDDL